MQTALFPFIAIALPIACLLVGAWPLVRLPLVRSGLSRLSGSGCIGVGIAIVGMFAGGFLPAAADDKPAATTEKAETPATKSESPTAEADPVIESARDTVEIPPGRPVWVGTEPNTRGVVHTVAVSSGPYKKKVHSERALDEAIVRETNEYIAEQLGSELAPTLLRYDAQTIKDRFLKEHNRYHDEASYSEPVGLMHEHFALLEFGQDFRNELNSKWTKVRAASRLGQVGLVSGAVLFLLGSVFSYFRLDNATRGYYTGRLQFMTAAAILAVVGAGALVARYITWL